MSTHSSGQAPSFAVDYTAVFRAFPGPALLLTPDLVMVRAGAALHNGETLSDEETMTAALLARSHELKELNERLRRAHARERQIAVSLQQAMLPDTARERSNVAVRYRPAVSALHVCGDWYDFLELGPGWLAVAVGDVVGHGLTAAGIMGQLRSALSAAMHATGHPARALKALAHYAVTVEGALATTAVQTLIDETTHTITYSRAGHPPPLLLHADRRTVHILDQVADPPLGVWEPEAVRTQATLAYQPGATLVLYTDGLIERRGQDIDTGLDCLTQNLTRHGHLSPEPLADALLTDLPPQKNGPDDDIALVVVQL
ncbi:serine/threonine-protein phosphatase [Streptomyces sp. TRM72054]|uniref:PP2C family protein-serine/threonine phosphatase n=1 Tax=Streptomyces sp. TRM72054 TaxID=2870562 RepID=UPI001C8BBDB9|nr:PP2C family protein-serine/threonine phosphatase [Streptomyces sp. TRM72054]MBX9399366.1 serine/threonine-protein phosphatase [Streptomyces sp. TRM72054]